MRWSLCLNMLRAFLRLRVSQRATFIVDPENVIRFVYVTDLSVGRDPKEVLRVLDALQNGGLTP